MENCKECNCNDWVTLSLNLDKLHWLNSEIVDSKYIRWFFEIDICKNCGYYWFRHNDVNQIIPIIEELNTDAITVLQKRIQKAIDELLKVTQSYEKLMNPEVKKHVG